MQSRRRWLVPKFGNAENKLWSIITGQRRSRRGEKPQRGRAPCAGKNGGDLTVSPQLSNIIPAAQRRHREQPPRTRTLTCRRKQGNMAHKGFPCEKELPPQRRDPPPPQVPALGAEDGLHTNCGPLPTQQPFSNSFPTNRE